MIRVGGSELTRAFVAALLLCSCRHDFDRFGLSDQDTAQADDGGAGGPADAGAMGDHTDADMADDEVAPDDDGAASPLDAGFGGAHDGGDTASDGGGAVPLDATAPAACRDVTLECGGERTVCQAMCVSAQDTCASGCDRMKCIRDCEQAGQECEAACAGGCVDCFSREGCAPVCPE